MPIPKILTSLILNNICNKVNLIKSSSIRCLTIPASFPKDLSQTSRFPSRDVSVEELSESIKNDLKVMFDTIHQQVRCKSLNLNSQATYFFDGKGKCIRPTLVLLMSRAVNFHVSGFHGVLENQLKIAAITEMIHTVSLMHDDVMDASYTRRNRPSLNNLYGQRMPILSGDYVLGQASRLLATIGCHDTIILLSQVLSDLVEGEFLQLDCKENQDERFRQYIDKTYKKTASLIAYSCQAAALLAGGNEALQSSAYNFGKSVGLTFQLLDDILDFVSNQTELGKPTAVDLKLGLATAPVIFACEKFPQLEELILRRFKNPGDVEYAFECVLESDGLEQTKSLAYKYKDEALKQLEALSHCNSKKMLLQIAENLCVRKK